MQWLNVSGLVFMAVIMIANIIYALKHKDAAENKKVGKGLEVMEQIGRYGCMIFMIINIPGTRFGWWSQGAFTAYLAVDALLVALYCLLWAVCRKKTLLRALALSALPSAVFLFSGIMGRSILLILSALIFAPSHILISCKNAT